MVVEALNSSNALDFKSDGLPTWRAPKETCEKPEKLMNASNKKKNNSS